MKWCLGRGIAVLRLEAVPADNHEGRAALRIGLERRSAIFNPGHRQIYLAIHFVCSPSSVSYRSLLVQFVYQQSLGRSTLNHAPATLTGRFALLASILVVRLLSTYHDGNHKQIFESIIVMIIEL